MRKLYYPLIGLVILAAIILIPPFFIGKMAQQRIENNVTLLNENQSVHVVVNHYQRHWFSSTANVEIQIVNQRVLMRLCKLTQCTNPLEPMILSADLHIAHGPLFWRMSSDNHPASLGLGLANVDGVFGLLHANNPDQKPLLSMNVTLGFTGSTQIAAKSLDLQTLLSGQNSVIVNKGIQLQLSIRDNGHKIKGHVSSDGLDLRENTGFNSSFAEGFSLSFDERHHDQGLWFGTWQFNLPRWQMVSTSADKPTFDWRGLHVEEKRSRGPDHTLNSTFNLSVKQFGDADHYGPLSLTMKSEGIDQQAYQSMRDLLEEMTLLQQEIAPASTNHTLDQAQRFQVQARTWILQRQLMALFPQLVRHGAVFSMSNLSLKTPEGDLKATAQLAFNKTKDNSENAVVGQSNHAVDVFSLLQSANTDVSVVVPKSLLHQVFIQANTASQLKMQQNKAMPPPQADNETSKDEVVRAKTTQTVPASSSSLQEKAQSRANQQLAEMVKQGILVEDTNQYRFSIRYDQKQLYLNRVETSVKALVDKFFKVAAVTHPKLNVNMQKKPQSVPSSPASTEKQQQSQDVMKQAS